VATTSKRSFQQVIMSTPPRHQETPPRFGQRAHAATLEPMRNSIEFSSGQSVPAMLPGRAVDALAA